MSFLVIAIQIQMEWPWLNIMLISQENSEPEAAPLGGNLSVSKPPNQSPIMFIGQDEAIFKQFVFLAKMWTGPDGERPLLPKAEGRES